MNSGLHVSSFCRQALDALVCFGAGTPNCSNAANGLLTHGPPTMNSDRRPYSPTMEEIRRLLADPDVLEQLAEAIVKRDGWSGGWPSCRRPALARIRQWLSDFDSHEFPIRHQDLLAAAAMSASFTAPAHAAAALAQAREQELKKPAVRAVRPRKERRTAG